MTTLTERDILVPTARSANVRYLISDYSITRDQPAEGVVSPPWLGRTKNRIREIGQLRADWDSYGASPVDPRIPPKVESLVEWFAIANMPPPDVFATTEGGIQIEWHVRRVNIEIEISPTDVTTIYFHDLNSGDEWSRPASPTDLQTVRRRLIAPL